MKGFVAFVRQPSTLIAAGCALGGVVYWFTGNGALALMSVGIIPGAVSDHTAGILSKVEALEDAARVK